MHALEGNGEMHPAETNGAASAPSRAAEIRRGVRRALLTCGIRSITEFTLKTGRRADVIGVDGAGHITIVEIKSSVADFRADQKWPDYVAFCDRFYFAVGADFPVALIPETCGLLVADAYGAHEVRPAPVQSLAPARRKKLVTDLALAACGRLHGLEDPAAWLDA